MNRVCHRYLIGVVVAAALAGWAGIARAQSVCDLTGDGKVTNADAGLLVQVALGKKKCPAGRSCDINNDGKVNVQDAQVLGKVARGARCPLKARAGTVGKGPNKPSSGAARPASGAARPSGGAASPTSGGGAASSDPPALFECNKPNMAPSLVLLSAGKVRRWDNRSVRSFHPRYWPPRNAPPILPRLGAPSAQGTYAVRGNTVTLTVGGRSQNTTSTTGDRDFGLVKFVIGGSTCHLVETGPVAGVANTFNYKCDANEAPFGGTFDNEHYFRFNKNGGVIWKRDVAVVQMGNTYYGVATGVYKLLPNNRIKIIFGHKPVVFIGKARRKDAHLRTVLTGATGHNVMTIDQRTVVKGTCNPG